MDNETSNEIVVGSPTVGSVMDNLHYTPRRIKELEDRLKKSLLESIADMSMSTLITLVMKGLNTDENGAYEAIETFLNEAPTNDTMQLHVKIIEKLEKQGFLLKSLNLSEKIKEKLQEAEKIANS